MISLMMRDRNPLNIRICADFYLLLASMILLFPLKWVMAFYAAATVHEIFHGLTMTVLGGRISELTLKASGIYMVGECEGGWNQILCSIAGPLGGLSCLLCVKWFPEVAVCALVQSLYNLLPLWPLDGGRILRLVLQEICPYKAQQVEGGVRIFILFAGVLAALWCIIHFRAGVIFFAFAISVLLKSVKTPCKARKKRIQ